MQNKININKYKPGNIGLYFRFILFCLILGIFSATAISCNDNNNKEEEVPPPTPGTNPADSGVIVLKPSDVKDYEKIYKPKEFSDMDWLHSDSKWSLVRSKQSEHFIVLWEKGFGRNPNADTVPQELRVDIDDLLKKAETFYNLNINTLKFANVGQNKSNLDKYKMQIYLIYQKEWLATGSGYDDMIGALWVNPSTCKPVGSTIAHEIGHSFQYQVYADLLATGQCQNNFSRGFRYGFGGNGGNAFWEQTAQWQSFQSYPKEAFESYNFAEYTANCHRHICHEWYRYASYFIHYYWTDKHGIDFIGKLWREAIAPEDPVEAYIRINKLTVEQMNDEMYDAATHLVTWDLEAIRSIGANYIGKQSYKLYTINSGTYQVAYSNCPGTTGYNVIPLNIPKAGTKVSAHFTGLNPGSKLANGDPGICKNGEETVKVTTYSAGESSRAGWRYGYLALLKGGQRIYGEMNKASESDAEFTVPNGCEKLWFVVTGAPTSYKSHAWDENEKNDDQWPYTVKFTNTDLLGNISFDGDEKPKDITLTFDIGFPFSATEYPGTTITLDMSNLTQLAKAFVLQPNEITGLMDSKIKFYAVEPDGSLNPKTTANGYGHWFDAHGKVCNWGVDGRIFSEYNAPIFTFSIGQYPNQCKKGDKFTIKQALVYEYEAGKTVKATFAFNITIQ